MIVGVCYTLLVGATLYFASAVHAVSVLWPANSLPLALAMLRPRRQWWAIMLFTFLGVIIATFTVRGVSLAPVFLGLANMSEVLLAAWLTNFSRMGDGIGGSARSMVRFTIGAGVAAPAFSSLIGGATFALFFGRDFLGSALIWFFADSLGILIFAPVFYTLLAGQYGRAWQEATVARRWEAGGLVLLTSLVAMLVFTAERPLVFLVIMPTMLVAFRLGWMGVKVAVMMVAVIGTLSTMNGHGPIVPLSEDVQLRAYFLQIFIAAQLMTQWPVVVALAARDRVMQELAKSEQSLRLLAARSAVLMLTFDVGGRCRKAIGAIELLHGHAMDDLPGLLIEELVENGGATLRPAHEMALDVPDAVHSVELRIWAGEERWLEASFRALEDEGGRCPGTLMTLHDVSTRKAQTMALARSAYTDSLTGLLNRAGFLLRLERALAGRTEGLVLAMIDVDRFKLINDNCGHQTGDAVLEEIARRISGQLRVTDSVGRMGGDEFVILLDTTEWDSAQEICRRLVDAVSAQPVRLASGQTIAAAISCGVVRHRVGMSADHFLHDADVALYEAKRGGRNRVVAA
ncbi:diguanylate cyclase [Sphingobium sufflavum]|uniref:sensor domain-containing diguanylate cyclase n=1 Tax=Sphingobium sufflavum TaxID=1129547 RepID=UPI001F1C539F|nr:diguanylate cyclase [Sphingobium sufflavum]MCE7795731.1 diguanylate cyclase [Sphingobium sufflavum]